MKRAVLSVLVLLFVLTLAPIPVGAHCEVPCGIYADQRRFEEMLEDQDTITKAMAYVRGLAEKSDAQSLNQAVRWVNTKETHATNTQHTIAQYFMTQRLKPEMDGYVEKLTSAHAVMRAAMKCKQSVKEEDAAALRSAIIAFHKSYEGEEK